MNLLLVEMRRTLHRRLIRWMIALALAGCAVMGLIAFTSSSTESSRTGDGHPAYLLDWWTPGSGEGLLLMGAVFLAIGAAICGASVAGAEWRAGTITTVLTWTPSRLRLHLARTASAAILSFLIGLALLVVFMAAAVPAMLAHGSTAGTDGRWWYSLVLADLRIAVVGSLVATLALSIATIGRNTAAALVALSVWALFLENLVRGLKPGLARFLIAENVATVVPWASMRGVEFSRPPAVALLTLVGYLAIAVGVATLTFRRRDVTAT